jgi:ClpP class serine protease
MLIRRILTSLGRKPAPIVSVIRLSGVIGAVGALRQGITLSALAPVIERAFAVPDQQAVALQINSPGGSPVQSALVAGRIRQLADEKKVPVIAFAGMSPLRGAIGSPAPPTRSTPTPVRSSAPSASSPPVSGSRT